MSVAVAGGCAFAAVVCLVFIVAYCWDPKKGFRGNRRTAISRKSEHRFDVWLFVWTMLYVTGSAVWLRAITDGDQFGRGITYPMWLSDRPSRFFSTDFFHPLSTEPDELVPSVSGFTIGVDAANCNYTSDKGKELAREEGEPPFYDHCGASNPQVPVHANVTEISGVRQGLVITIHTSSDFKTCTRSRNAGAEDAAPTACLRTRVLTRLGSSLSRAVQGCRPPRRTCRAT